MNNNNKNNVVVKKNTFALFLKLSPSSFIFVFSILIWQNSDCRCAELEAAPRLDRLLSPVPTDAEWLAHSEQLCHSSQHPSLPPSHPSVTLHGVQRHHLGLCDRSHVAAGQWQCSLSPQLWPRLPVGLQEPRGHPRQRPRAGHRHAVRSHGCGGGGDERRGEESAQSPGASLPSPSLWRTQAPGTHTCAPPLPPTTSSSSCYTRGII